MFVVEEERRRAYFLELTTRDRGYCHPKPGYACAWEISCHFVDLLRVTLRVIEVREVESSHPIRLQFQEPRRNDSVVEIDHLSIAISRQVRQLLGEYIDDFARGFRDDDSGMLGCQGAAET